MSVKPRTIALGMAVAASVAAPAALAEKSPDSTEKAPTQNVVEIAASNPDFSTLVALVQTANLAGALSTTSPITVFAPTNDAFASLPKATVKRITSRPAALKSVLTYHVAPAKLTASDVVAMRKIPTLQGGSIRVQVAGSTVRLDGRSTVTATDIMATNGVVHVIDNVLLPRRQQDVVSLLSGNPNFTTFVDLVKRAGITEGLASGSLTVFAPTNRAFARVPKATLDKLAANPAALKKVLASHVARTSLPAWRAARVSSIRTASGARVTVKMRRGVTTANGARVVRKNVRTANGIIHAVDRVLIP